jgi:peptidyl-tRNA hydrolase
LYALVRTDLQMTPGKMAAQTGHAFLDTFEECRNKDPTRAQEYHNGQHGTKIVLGVPDEYQLQKIYEEATQLGLPCALIIDSGHIMPPKFDGLPITTALGIGPAHRHEISHLTNKFQLVK